MAERRRCCICWKPLTINLVRRLDIECTGEVADAATRPLCLFFAVCDELSKLPDIPSF
jgi:hypothetical protein